MKINFILTSLGKSGGIDVVYRHAENLSNKGHDVCIYKSYIVENQGAYNNKFLDNLHRTYTSAKSIVLNSFERNHEFDHFVFGINNNTIRDADATIATAWPTAYEVAKLNESKGKKIYFVQGFETWNNKSMALKSYLLPLNIITVSSWINDQLKKVLNIGPFPIVFNGIDSRYLIEKKNKDDNEDDNAKITCLMLNHDLEIKGVNIGLRAFEKAKEIYPKINLNMFGTVSGSNLPRFVKYYQNPSKSKISELYKNADIFIFPSLEEGWGLTPLEAMGSKCAVVASKTGFVLDLGIDEENILISEVGDVDKIATDIVRLIKDSTLRERISRNGYLTAKELNWEKSTQKFEYIINQIN